jgi:hypothetical protein
VRARRRGSPLALCGLAAAGPARPPSHTRLDVPPRSPIPARAVQPAWVKWGQWAATRHDVFPPDMCAALEVLHASAPAHSFRETDAAIQRAFGLPAADVFEWLEEAPLASGSIGQASAPRRAARRAAHWGGGEAFCHRLSARPDDPQGAGPRMGAASRGPGAAVGPQPAHAPARIGNRPRASQADAARAPPAPAGAPRAAERQGRDAHRLHAGQPRGRQGAPATPLSPAGARARAPAPHGLHHALLHMRAHTLKPIQHTRTQHTQHTHTHAHTHTHFISLPPPKPQVRHPHVSDAIERDFRAMVWLAHAAGALLPALRELRLEDTLKQFEAPLHEQVGDRGSRVFARGCFVGFWAAWAPGRAWP